jgi:large subunit ribosomal protein L28
MSKICVRCGKKPVTGNNVSHSNRKTRRRWLPNLQKTTVVESNGSSKQVRMCTRCIRTLRNKATVTV